MRHTKVRETGRARAQRATDRERKTQRETEPVTETATATETDKAQREREGGIVQHFLNDMLTCTRLHR